MKKIAFPTKNTVIVLHSPKELTLEAFYLGNTDTVFFILNQNVNSRREQVIEKNAELTIQNSDLQKKVVELHHVSDECQQLKSTLNKVESECVTAQSEVRNLSGKVRNLECVLEEMHKAAENRREIERQHKEVISLNFLPSSHFIRTLHITIPLIIYLCTVDIPNMVLQQNVA